MSTLAYYRQNAIHYARRTQGRVDAPAIEEFTRALPPGAKILDAGCGSGRDLKIFRSLGYEAQGCDFSPELAAHATEFSGAEVSVSDLQLLSLKKESLDGIWANHSLPHLPPASCQRALGSFFQALKPGGVLFCTIEVAEEESSRPDTLDNPTGPPRTFHAYPEHEFASLLRQSGFTLLKSGKSPAHPTRVAFLAKRIA